MKIDNLKIAKTVCALVLAGSIALSSPSVIAEKIETKGMNGQFLEQRLEYEESQYKLYVVEEGDNISKISKKICRMFGEEVTTKYWPVLAYLNGFPRVIQPGEIIQFPDTFEDMDSLWSDLKDSGWIKNYVKCNDVYGHKNKKITIGEILDSIYGMGASKDPVFVQTYLEAVGLGGGKYNANSKLNGDQYWQLTEWIPTIEELMGCDTKKLAK